jgi:hypothetical protein
LTAAIILDYLHDAQRCCTNPERPLHHNFTATFLKSGLQFPEVSTPPALLG